jgi:PAS domain S-box-containing protein
MHWQFTPYTLPLLIAAAISATIAFCVWRRRRAPGATPLVLLMLAVAEWSLGYALELGSTGLLVKIFWVRLQYLGIVTVSVMWLAFTLQYTGREKWLTRRNLALVTIEPFVTLLLVWTNDVHHLFYRSVRLDTSGSFSVLDLTYGLWFWVNAAYSYLLLLLGAFLLIQALVRSPHLYRGQAGALLGGVLAPWVGNALYISGLNPFPHLDLTPFAFTLTGLAMTWGLFHFRLLDIVPVARDAIVESMADGVIVLDAQNRIVDLNPAAQQIIGHRASEAIGQLAAQALSDWPDLVERYLDVTEAHLEVVLGEGEARRTLDLRISSLHGRNGSLTGRLVVLRDVTKRKRAEEALQKAHDELERRVRERTAELSEANVVLQREIAERKQAEQALRQERASLAQRVEERTAELSAANAELAQAARLKDEFLASMSHELRTPLNAVLGLCEALQEQVYGPLNERQFRPLRTIEESGRHLLALINDILDVAKIGAGKLELEIGPVSVESVCQDSLGLIKRAAQKKRLKISTSFDGAVEIVQADQRRLKQILVNLLSNAVKFTPEGGEIGLEVVGDAEQGAVHFIIWDTGIGIAQEEIGRLFQPFVQLDSSLSRQHSGTGLGLALVRRLTELHGGGISLESKVGKGSRFTVSLPCPPVDKGRKAKGEGLAEERHPFEVEATGALALRRALVIEDSPTCADQLTRYLAELGVETVVHPRGEGAVEEAMKVHPDVIILDILLPAPSGWEVLAQLKAEPRTQDIPVVMVSVVDERSQGLAQGAAEYLVKPISRWQLQRALSQIVPQEVEEPMPLVAMADQEPETERPLILLAEDNEDNITTVSDYLLAKGYRVVVAREGAEAIQRAREERPDLILMDIQMPGMDGLEATQRLRAEAVQNGTTVPIIALTALAMPGDRERCLAAGVDEYLSKPVSLKGLVQVIEAQLGFDHKSGLARRTRTMLGA